MAFCAVSHPTDLGAVVRENMALPRWIIGTVAVGALALVAAACGDDDDAAPEDPESER